jgi:hypothetical protein
LYFTRTTGAGGGSVLIEALLVAGGGGGGAYHSGGGGGGGGVVYNTSISIDIGTFPVVVGTGGTGGIGQSGVGETTHSTKGNDSTFKTYTANGGGKARDHAGGGDPNGGCGGGATGYQGGSSFTGGTGSQGGNGGNSDGNAPNYGGGGGGGLGGNGANGTSSVGGDGGPGTAYTISGSSVTYGGGGGGGANGGTGGSGTGGGGNAGSTGGNGTDGLGGGGGGGNSSSGSDTGGDGGDGVVIIRYITGTVTATGGTITTSGGYTIHTFTTSGDFVVSGTAGSNGRGKLVITSTETGLTSGRIPYATTGGFLTNSANLTYDGSVLGVTGSVSASTNVLTPIIKTDTSTPTDLTITTGAAKTLVLGTGVYNDENVGALFLRTGGTAPGLVQWKDNDGDDTGIYTIAFADGEQGSGSIEIPHDYKEGTDLTFHIHYGLNDAPTGTDKIRFDLIYNVQRDGTTFVDAITIDSTDVSVDTQYKTGRIDFTAITGTTFKIGDQFNFTVKRTTAVGDAYAGEVLVQTIGFHYQADTMGSRQIETK